MFVTFVVVRGHALSKELAGGRVRAKRGEQGLAAVVRRVEQDTRCRVVSAIEVAEGSRGAYELTLRGHLCTARGRLPGLVEGAVRVTLHQGDEVLGPRGARRVHVPAAGRDARRTG